MLVIEDLCAGYEGVDVVHGVTVSVRQGSIVAMIGANGAGKSTTLRAVSGLIRVSAGSVTVDGRRLRMRSEREIVQAGIAHVPEGRQVFSNLTVRENLELGGFATSNRSETAARLEEMLNLFPALRPRLAHYAGSLSGGQQQMLAIARGLMGSPRYLLLDEPSLGLAPLVVESIMDVIVELRVRGVGILLVEQNGRLALSKADEACLLEQGRVTLSGTGSALLADPNVVERYLGVGVSLGDDQRRRELALRLRRALVE
jgi:branched-chain amino acid transport system ATP-binding protein